jgi:hypothetical protein
MVETALFSGYKIQRTKGHMGKRKGQNRGAERREKKKKKTGRRTGKGQGNEQDRGEQIFCPCFFSKKQRRSCLTIVRHEHGKKGHSLAL